MEGTMLARLDDRAAHSGRTWLVLAATASLIGATLLVSRPQVKWAGALSQPASHISSDLPLSFEPNAGQADLAARFVAHTRGGNLFFTDSGVILALNAAPSAKATTVAARTTRAANTSPTVVQLEFVGASASPDIGGGEMLPGKTNYIKGDDRSRWHTNLPTYSGIVYSGLYAGIDLRYEGSGGQLKGTYTLAPGADPSLIRWHYVGARSASVDTGGNLQVALTAAADGRAPTLTEHAPVAWQEIGGRRVAIGARYVDRGGGTYSFQVDSYDHTKPLTIDPTLAYSTYLGGFYGDSASSIALDSAGNIYVGGTTSSSDFPVAGDPFQPVYGGGEYDMFVSKLSPDGSSLIYSTFVGGDNWDVGGLAGVDAVGIATLGGWTASEDFPTTPGAYQTTFAGTEDVAIAKLNADGSDLIFGSYWGDEAVDEPYGFTIDGAGNTYFTGYYLPGFSFWAFVAALNSDGSQQLFRHNLGGSVPGPGDENANTAGEGIEVDSAGNVYVTGYTRAADFPTTPGAYRTSIQAFEDGFMTKLSPLGQSLMYSTYINGGVSEYPADIAIDSAGNAYITGNTSSADYPTTPGAFESECGDPRCAFVTKLNPSGSALVYSTFLGGPEFFFETEDYGFAVRVNQAGNAYVAGYTSAPDFPVADPIQPTLSGPYDGFLTRFNVSGTGVEFSTYLGGSSGDLLSGIALDGLGHVYLAGSSSSTDFPVVNPYQPTMHGGGDAIVAVIAEAGAVTATPSPTRTGTPATATPTANPCGGVTPWRTETPMLIARSNSASAVLDNQLYVIAGVSSSPTPVRYTQKFDPVGNSWTNKAAYPDGLGLAYQQAAAVNGKIYTVAATYQPSESFIEMYDPSSDTWSRKANLPEPLQIGAVTSYAGKVYLIGGQVVNQLPSAHVYEYDPVTDTITPKASMPTGQAEVGAAVIGDRIYAVGGFQYIHYVYDPAANSWSTIAAPPTPSFSFPAVFAFNGELWVIGGYDNWTQRGYPPGQEVQIYNPLTNTWRYGPALNQPRFYSTAAGVIYGRAYLVGGIELDSDPYNYLNSMESIAYLQCGTTTPTALATQPTRTVMPTTAATATATATGTICPIQFTDVPEGSTFYPFVRCLACQGIVSGYPCGGDFEPCDPDNNPYFRPNNPVTRGQISKIISLSAGFNEPVPSTQQSFEDVVYGSTFWEYIERLYSRGVVGGYECGINPAEPCIPPESRPYFRPNAGATRGQLVKIASESAGFSDTIPDTQYTFTDVLPGSTFWLYIERLLANRPDAISGYPCGGPFEPCDSGNRPYFRPNNGVTRGQASKIVANTFFPGCNPPGRPGG
jgi:N-acetylneuraminic acid mutarotase